MKGLGLTPLFGDRRGFMPPQLKTNKNKTIFAEFPGLVMRHEAIEMVCAHIRQDQAPPPHHRDVKGMSEK